MAEKAEAEWFIAAVNRLGVRIVLRLDAAPVSEADKSAIIRAFDALMTQLDLVRVTTTPETAMSELESLRREMVGAGNG